MPWAKMTVPLFPSLFISLPSNVFLPEKKGEDFSLLFSPRYTCFRLEECLGDKEADHKENHDEKKNNNQWNHSLDFNECFK